MPFYFIDTLVGDTRCSDRIGAEFPDADAAIRTAFSALLDIAQDENDLQVDVDVLINVQDFDGRSIFRGQLRTLRDKRAGPQAMPEIEANPVERLQSA